MKVKGPQKTFGVLKKSPTTVCVIPSLSISHMNLEPDNDFAYNLWWGLITCMMSTLLGVLCLAPFIQ